MPGVKREDIHIDINDDVLTIAAEWDTEKKNERQNGYIMNERRSGRASRSFTLENVKEDEISAEYKDGVLTLTMPKVTETRKSPRQDRDPVILAPLAARYEAGRLFVLILP